MKLYILLITSCIVAANVKTTNAQTTLKTVSPKIYIFGNESIPYVSLRPVLIGEAYFGYRAYDYRGGFYICTQIASASKEEYERQTAFDDIKEQSLYLMHYIPDGRANPNSWDIQQYRMYCLELPSLETLDTIDFETIANHPDWQWAPEIRKPAMPDYLLLWNHLDEQVKALRQTETTETLSNQWITKFYDTIAKESPFDVTGLIRELKAQDMYDTISKTDYSTLYVNTDYLCYEIVDDPEVFYVSKREYHPNGTLKNQGYFLSGVYQSESLLFGPYVSLDESGNPIHIETLNQVFFPEMAYYLGWLEARKYIDPKTGKGKPTMRINAHINPHEPSHGETRVRIETNWQVQTDEEAGTVAILIKEDDGKETVFIFSNASKIIWDKFNR